MTRSPSRLKRRRKVLRKRWTYERDSLARTMKKKRTMSRSKSRPKKSEDRTSRPDGKAAPELIYLGEPLLTFGLEQQVEDPRDGLVLFGPLDQGRPYGIRAAVIGSDTGIRLYREWVHRIQGRLVDRGSPVARPPFPGFETAFRVPWGTEPVLTISVPDAEIQRAVLIADKHVRVHTAVGVFAERILEAMKREEAGVDVWFVVIPDIVHKNCRPK